MELMEVKNTVSEMKRSLHLKTQQQKLTKMEEKKRIAKNEQSLSNLWDNIKQSDMKLESRREEGKVRKSI